MTVATASWYLLARRPGWRHLDALTDLDVSTGALRLAAVGPPPPPPATQCALAGCGDVALVDRRRRVVSFVTGDCQVRRVAGPYALTVAGDGVESTRPTRRLGPGDVEPVLEWPAGTWEPAAVVPAGPGQVWVLDVANACLHLLDRRRGWLERHAGTTVPPAGADLEPTEAPFAIGGRAVIGPLDSGLEGCEWHRVVLAADVPLGTRAGVRTFTSDVVLGPEEIALLDDGQWSSPSWCTAPSPSWDTLIRSFPGRFLWLEIALTGDGAATPTVDDAEVHFPRVTTRRYLPAAMVQGPDGGAFLDRFLALTDRVRATVTSHLDDLPLLLDPDAVPADASADFLAWLSSWLGVDDVDALPVARRRRLLAEAASLYRQRGTPLGVARHAALWLGREVHLLEHYRLRRWAVTGNGRLGDNTRLFGPAVVRRLQLDVHSTIGEFRLIDVPDPRRDPFHFTAHRFTMVVRARRHDDPEALADQAAHVVAVVAPAHTLADVAVVMPQLRVGMQATIGVDALVAGPPDPVPLASGPDGTFRLGAAPLAPDPHHLGDRVGQHARIARTAVG